MVLRVGLQSVVVPFPGNHFLYDNLFPKASVAKRRSVRVAKLAMCLTAGMCLTADPGFTYLIPARSHTFEEIDLEIFSTAILLPSADSIMVVGSYKRK